MTFCASLASNAREPQIELWSRAVDPVTNPYAPGAGTPPPLLAGRDRVIEAWDVVIGRAAAGNSFQPIVLSGLRGVGKTVLLLEFRAHARDAGWPIELFEARPGGDLRAQVAEALPPMIRTVNRRWRNKERAKTDRAHRGQLRPGGAGPAGRTAGSGSRSSPSPASPTPATWRPISPSCSWRSARGPRARASARRC